MDGGIAAERAGSPTFPYAHWLLDRTNDILPIAGARCEGRIDGSGLAMGSLEGDRGRKDEIDIR